MAKKSKKTKDVAAAETMTTEMVATAEHMTARTEAATVSTAETIGSLIDERVSQATHAESVKKWTKEKAPFMALATFFQERELDVGFLRGIAIYAAQKVRRLAKVMSGISKIDPYTVAILKSAAALQKQSIPFSGDLQMATLTTDAEAAHKLKLPVRLSYRKGTASTQASSTRKALQALGMATIAKEGSDDVLNVNFDHPIVQKILGGEIAVEGEEEGAEA